MQDIAYLNEVACHNVHVHFLVFLCGWASLLGDTGWGHDSRLEARCGEHAKENWIQWIEFREIFKKWTNNNTLFNIIICWDNDICTVLWYHMYLIIYCCFLFGGCRTQHLLGGQDLSTQRAECQELNTELSRQQQGPWEVVSKNKGTPKWRVKIMENPLKMDDLGGKPTIFGNIHVQFFFRWDVTDILLQHTFFWEQKWYSETARLISLKVVKGLRRLLRQLAIPKDSTSRKKPQSLRCRHLGVKKKTMVRRKSGWKKWEMWHMAIVHHTGFSVCSPTLAWIIPYISHICSLGIGHLLAVPLCHCRWIYINHINPCHSGSLHPS